MITKQNKMKFKINIMEILKTKKPLLKYIIHQEEKVTLFLDDTCEIFKGKNYFSLNNEMINFCFLLKNI